MTAPSAPRSVRWLEARYPDGFATVPYQRADLERLGLTERECHERIQWIDDVVAPVTSRESGSRAIGALLRRGGTRRGGAVGVASRAAAGLTVVPARFVAGRGGLRRRRPQPAPPARRNPGLSALTAPGHPLAEGHPLGQVTGGPQVSVPCTPVGGAGHIDDPGEGQ